MLRRIPRPDRIRHIEGSFGWIDHGLLRRGHLERMTLPEISIYVFLILAADREGVSFYRKDRICRTLGIDWNEFERDKDRLLERGLIAFEAYGPGQVDGFWQVLSVPACPKDLSPFRAGEVPKR